MFINLSIVVVSCTFVKNGGRCDSPEHCISFVFFENAINVYSWSISIDAMHV